MHSSNIHIRSGSFKLSGSRTARAIQRNPVLKKQIQKHQTTKQKKVDLPALNDSIKHKFLNTTQHNTTQNKTKQNKTKQNKTKQNKTTLAVGNVPFRTVRNFLMQESEE